jgi:hypothetical protein
VSLEAVGVDVVGFAPFTFFRNLRGRFAHPVASRPLESTLYVNFVFEFKRSVNEVFMEVLHVDVFLYVVLCWFVLGSETPAPAPRRWRKPF